ncbi:MAG: DUF599 family protein [Pikeienuella sp.]
MNEYAHWLGPFTLWDASALAWFAIAFWATGRMVNHHPKAWLATGEMVAAYRMLWMRRAARREVRVTDITLLATLRNSATFLASMTIFALGGAVALLGQMELLESVAISVAGGLEAPRAAQQGKTLILIGVLVYAFLKFIWSVRIFGYCAIVMGAMPGDREEDAEEEIEREAARAAALNRIAGRNFNAGLRALYFALALLAWLLGPIALAVSTTLTTAMLARREFASETRAALRFSSFR